MNFFLMNRLFLQTVHISLLLGLLSGPTLTWCTAAVIDSGTAVRSAYALKHTISSVNEKDPVKALSASTALALLSATDVQLHMYGTFTTVPDPKNPGRTMKVFTTNPPTTLNEITRSMLDVLDDKLNATIQESNPFSGLEAHTISQMVKVLEKSGVTGLLKQLRKELGIAEPKQDTRGKKGKGNDQSTTTEELAQEEIMPGWTKDWDAKANPKNDDGSSIQKDPKKIYSLTEFIKKIKKFVQLLEKLNADAKTDLEKAQVTEIFSKLLMNFLYAKDQKESGTTKGAHSIVDYYSALLETEFKAEYYTTEELEQIEKTLLGQDSTHTIGKDAKGIEDTTAYLAHFVAGDVAFLQAPFDTYTSPDKSFAYCAEATIRSLVNSLLYNPETGKLDITLLPLEIQKTLGQTSLGQKFKDFIEKYPDPTAPNYYGNSLKEWLDLVSGIDGVEYNNKIGKEAYEISAGAGPKNLVTVMNAIFGTKADSFETFATAVEVKDEHGAIIRNVSFTPNASGFDLKVTDHGKILIQAEVGSKIDVRHAAFKTKGKKIIDLLNNDTFRTKIAELSDATKQDLYGVLFKPSTLNVEAGNLGIKSTPLILAIQRYGNSIVKSMLAFGADPNFQGTNAQTPLEIAVYSKDDSIAYELLKNGAHVTEKALLKACISGNLELVKTFIPLLEHDGISPNYADMLLKASMSQSFSLVEFLLSKGADINGRKDLGNTPLLQAIAGEDPLKMVEFLIAQGAHVTKEMLTKACSVGNFELVKTLMPLVEQGTTTLDYTQLLLRAGSQSLPLVEFLLAKGANINGKNGAGDSLLVTAIDNSRKMENSASTIAKYLIKKGAALTPSDDGTSLLSLAITRGRADITELLIQYGAPLIPDVLETILDSKRFTLAEKIQLTKSFLEKDGPVSTDVLKAVKANAIEDKNDDEEDRLEKKQWAELLPLLEQAHTEQSFGLNLTTQEQKCITECVTKAL